MLPSPLFVNLSTKNISNFTPLMTYCCSMFLSYGGEKLRIEKEKSGRSVETFADGHQECETYPKCERCGVPDEGRQETQPFWCCNQCYGQIVDDYGFQEGEGSCKADDGFDSKH